MGSYAAVPSPTDSAPVLAPPAAPRRFHRGWRVVVALCLVVAPLTWGQIAVPVLLKQITADLGLSRESLAGAGALGGITMGLSFLLAGYLIDRFGPRWVYPAFGLLNLAGFLLVATAHHLWQLYLGFGVFGSMAFAVGVGPSVSIVSRWFHRRRAMALSIVLASPYLGFIAFPLITTALESSIGWRWTMACAAIVPMTTLLLATPLVQRSPRDAGMAPYGMDDQASSDAYLKQTRAEEQGGMTLGQAAKTLRFWVFVWIFISINFAMGIVMFHLFSYMTDKGISQTTAAAVISVFSVASIVSRLGSGLLVDRVGPARVLRLTPGLVACSMAALAFLTTAPGLFVFAIAYGAFVGANNISLPLVVRSTFGEASLGAIIGAVLSAGNLGGAVAVYLGGAIFEHTGSYVPAFYIAAGCAAAAMAGVLWLRLGDAERRGWKPATP
ncbi:MAG: MFS transporter [Dehalococcoidia bacterium]|nr:MFS transporter [Dehalococcoidia bacterium]